MVRCSGGLWPVVFVGLWRLVVVNPRQLAFVILFYPHNPTLALPPFLSLNFVPSFFFIYSNTVSLLLVAHGAYNIGLFGRL
jgi:hypothetical protein